MFSAIIIVGFRSIDERFGLCSTVWRRLHRVVWLSCPRSPPWASALPVVPTLVSEKIEVSLVSQLVIWGKNSELYVRKPVSLMKSLNSKKRTESWPDSHSKREKRLKSNKITRKVSNPYFTEVKVHYTTGERANYLAIYLKTPTCNVFCVFLVVCLSHSTK